MAQVQYPSNCTKFQQTWVCGMLMADNLVFMNSTYPFVGVIVDGYFEDKVA